jgi:cellulose synthase/poly-beta-1,6-N-acetylglucosamine synthase-like glycosyltransferase
MPEIILLLVLWLFVFLQIIIIAGYFSEKPQLKYLRTTPPIAILIAARNEEANIIQCLESICKLNYPPEYIEIWIGNDGSKDKTAELVANFISGRTNFHLFQVVGEIGLAKAKGNVLAQLVKQSKAAYIFVTDADISVAPNWIKQLLPLLLEANTGIVSGTTLVNGNNYFSKWQGIDWSIGSGNLIGLDRLGMKSTAVGNNMCFTREAYYATGGYEAMPFSVTEDFQLFNAIRAKGYESVNVLDKDSLNISKSQTNIKAFLHQRKRWMIGAQDLPFYWLLIFGLQAAFYPSLFLLLLMHAKLAISIWLIKVFLQFVFIGLIQKKLKVKWHWPSLLSYEAYSIFIHFAMIGFYLYPVKMDWKDRKYAI